MNTLERLMAQVGCTRYPKRWEQLFAAAMERYDREGCVVSEKAFLDGLEDRYGCFEKYGHIYRAAAAQVRQDEALGRFLTLLSTALADTTHKQEDLRLFTRPSAPVGKDPLGYEMITGLALCSQLDAAAAHLRSLGLPESVVKQNITLAVNSVDTYIRRHKGQPGFDLLDWAQLYLEGKLFWIDRLEIELFGGFEGYAAVFQNAAGTCVALAQGITLHKSGYALGAVHYGDPEGSWTADITPTNDGWEGYPYLKNGAVSPEKCFLSRKEWKMVVQQGKPVIRLHIPPAGPLTPEAVDRTLYHVQQFLKKWFPDYPRDVYTCASWLMDPKLEELFPGSNICAFGCRFERLTIPNDGNGVFNFVFHQPDMNFSIKGLPENTRLEKTIKNLYLRGKAIYAMVGFFVSKE